MGGAIRLVNGTNAAEGTVEVCIGGRYGTVCDDHWNELDARVVCRQLGYSGEAVALKRAFFGSSPSRPIYLDNVGCNGSEPSLLNCTASEVGVNNCDHSEDAGVRCNGMLSGYVCKSLFILNRFSLETKYTLHACCFLHLHVASCIDGSVRLMVGEDYDYYYGETNYDNAYYIKDELARGRVEVCVGGRYGTICDDSWDNMAASVICRQLGFSPYGKLHKCIFSSK